MRYRYKQCAVMAIVGLLVSTAAVADELAQAWQKRSEQAVARLQQKGLDVCDRAYEQAFSAVKVKSAGARRTFDLAFTIGGNTLMAAYVYQGDRLDSFVMIDTPPRWLLVQKPQSKTVSVLVHDAQCAFDLCIDDPFAPGACADDR